MFQIFGLILPLFGLILIGYAVARITRQPLEALGWLNTFIIYVALPALFFLLLQKTPIEQLANWDFIATSLVVTFAIAMIGFGIGLWMTRGRIDEATIQGLAASYGNIGYMGPAIATLTFTELAAVPVALIFCFENMMHFALAPAMMALAGQNRQGVVRLALGVVKRIALNPFILATAAGVTAAALEWSPPEPLERLIAYLAQAAAPCALFAMGVTLALRPMRRVPVELGYIVPLKLIVHPAAMYLALSYVGPFDPIWLYTAVLLAALPTATSVFVIAEQYGVWSQRASTSILVTTGLSVFTVSGFVYVVSFGYLPVDFFASR